MKDNNNNNNNNNELCPTNKGKEGRKEGRREGHGREGGIRKKKLMVNDDEVEIKMEILIM